LEASEVVL